MKVFVSGSIAVKSLPPEVRRRLDALIAQEARILVGDAPGVDALVQRYCAARDYTHVEVFTISEPPRTIASERFAVRKIEVPDAVKRARERQAFKDRAMTRACDASFVVWDGKSKGSFANITRAFDAGKRVTVYLVPEERFLSPDEIDKETIESIFRAYHGYTASEVIAVLARKGNNRFKRPRDLTRYLLARGVVTEEDGVLAPAPGSSHLFLAERYRGKRSGIRYANAFLAWIERTPEEGDKNSSGTKTVQQHLFHKMQEQHDGK